MPWIPSEIAARREPESAILRVRAHVRTSYFQAEGSGAAVGGPDNASPSLAEVLATRAVARALYLDALRGLLYGGSLDDDLENTVLEGGVDLAVVEPLG